MGAIRIWTEETITIKLKEIMEEIGKFPSGGELQRMGYSSVYSAIYLNGLNIAHFRNKFNLPLRNEWNEEKAIAILRDISAKIGEFPTQIY